MIRKVHIALVLLCVTGLTALGGRVALGARDGASRVLLPAVLSAVGYDIAIEADGFRPHVLAVAGGEIVEWANLSGSAQTLTAANDVFVSPAIAPGGRYQWAPTGSGVYPYTAGGAAGLEGAIVVSPNGAADFFDDRTVGEAYRDSCGACHGADRQGAIGPALVPESLTASDSFYIDTIRNGRPGTPMPNWKYTFTDAEIWMMLGFLRSPVDESEATWEMDDIIASREQLVEESTLPPAPTHTGNMDNLMLVTEREAQRIAVFDGDTHALLGRVDSGYRAHGYAFDPANERWAFNIGRDGWLHKIDLYSLQPVSRIRVGLDSRGLAISDDGKYVIAGNFAPATAVILDAATLQPLKLLHTEGYGLDGEWVKSRVAITSDVAPELVGPYFIIALKEAGQMWRIDYSQPDFPVTKLADVGRILHDGFLSPDNKRFYIASQGDNQMVVIDVENWKVVARINTGDTPHPGSGATWEANGAEYGATTHAGEGLVTVWDLADNEIVAKIPTSGPGLFIRTHDQTPYVWADTMFAAVPNRIYVIDKASHEVVHVIEEGTQPLHPEMTDDGRYVYIADWQDEVIRVYDAETFARVAVLDGVVTPTGIFNTSRRGERLGH